MSHSYRVTPFRAWHMEWLTARGTPADGVGLTLPPSALAEAERQNTWTGVWEGDPIAVAGTMLQWPGRHLAWAYLPLATGRHMRWITREVRSNLATLDGRIEMTVRADFAPGLRWAKMLGFEIETPLLRRFGPQGEDHVGFVRIN